VTVSLRVGVSFLPVTSLVILYFFLELIFILFLQFTSFYLW